MGKTTNLPGVWADVSRRNIESIAAALSLAAIGACILFYATTNLEIRLAWSGFSPTYFVAFVELSVVRDFETGGILI